MDRRHQPAVIDLGVLEPWGSTPAGPPWRSRGWHRGRWSRRRPVALPGLLAGLVLALLAGAAPPAAGGPVPVALPPAVGGRFDVVGDLLLVAESGTRWAAYDLRTGERRWSLRRPEGAPHGLVAHGGILLDQLFGGSGVLDPATGQPRTVPPTLLPGQVQLAPGADTALVTADNDP